jgi:hypothetical protein
MLPFSIVGDRLGISKTTCSGYAFAAAALTGVGAAWTGADLTGLSLKF